MSTPPAPPEYPDLKGFTADYDEIRAIVPRRELGRNERSGLVDRSRRAVQA